MTRSGIEPRPPAPRADALTTVLRGGGRIYLEDIGGTYAVIVHERCLEDKEEKIC